MTFRDFFLTNILILPYCRRRKCGKRISVANASNFAFMSRSQITCALTKDFIHARENAKNYFVYNNLVFQTI